jgi:hypothetical protein
MYPHPGSLPPASRVFLFHRAPEIPDGDRIVITVRSAPHPAQAGDPSTSWSSVDGTTYWGSRRFPNTRFLSSLVAADNRSSRRIEDQLWRALLLGEVEHRLHVSRQFVKRVVANSPGLPVVFNEPDDRSLIAYPMVHKILFGYPLGCAMNRPRICRELNVVAPLTRESYIAQMLRRFRSEVVCGSRSTPDRSALVDRYRVQNLFDLCREGVETERLIACVCLEPRGAGWFTLGRLGIFQFKRRLIAV